MTTDARAATWVATAFLKKSTYEGADSLEPSKKYRIQIGYGPNSGQGPTYYVKNLFPQCPERKIYMESFSATRFYIWDLDSTGNAYDPYVNNNVLCGLAISGDFVNGVYVGKAQERYGYLDTRTGLLTIAYSTVAYPSFRDYNNAKAIRHKFVGRKLNGINTANLPKQ
jgi:hypothetical protein